jgi:hypothetical protein
MTPEFMDKISELQAAQREMALLQKIHTETLDKQLKLLESQRDILTTNTVIVKDHERRSTQLEGRMGILEEKLSPIEKYLAELAAVNKVMKILGTTFTFLASAATIIELIKMFAK